MELLIEIVDYIEVFSVYPILLILIPIYIVFFKYERIKQFIPSPEKELEKLKKAEKDEISNPHFKIFLKKEIEKQHFLNTTGFHSNKNNKELLKKYNEISDYLSLREFRQIKKYVSKVKEERHLLSKRDRIRINAAIGFWVFCFVLGSITVSIKYKTAGLDFHLIEPLVLIALAIWYYMDLKATKDAAKKYDGIKTKKASC